MSDSRIQSAVGYVPFENLIGKAQFILFSIGGGAAAWGFGIGRRRYAGAGCSPSSDEWRD